MKTRVLSLVLAVVMIFGVLSLASCGKKSFDYSKEDLSAYITLAEKDYLEAVKKELPERLHTAVENLVANWTSHMPPVEGMEAVVAEIKASGKGIYLLSNFNKRLRNELYLAPSLLMFDGLVLSGEIGMVKPNVEIYEYLLNKYGLDASECLFVDDRLDNIEAGEKCGIAGYLFDGDAEKFRAYLKENNII